MDLEKKAILDSRLQDISNELLLKANFVDDLGLFTGKMGIAIYFYQYARYTNNEIYKRYAGELIDEICEEISLATPIDFENGLTGIGWGIEYLVKNGFIEADTDEVLAEIDDAIFQATMQTSLYIHNFTSFFGYGFYYLARLRVSKDKDENPSTLKMVQMLVYILDEFDKLLKTETMFTGETSKLTFSQINSILWFILETKKLEFSTLNSHNLEIQLVLYLVTKMENNSDFIDSSIFNHFTNELTNLFGETVLRSEYGNLRYKIQNNYTPDNENVEQIVSEYLKSGWNSMLYNLQFNNLKHDYSEKAFVIVTSDENWSQRVEKLNINNLGLNNGMAGLGMAIIENNKISSVYL